MATPRLETRLQANLGVEDQLAAHFFLLLFKLPQQVQPLLKLWGETRTRRVSCRSLRSSPVGPPIGGAEAHLGVGHFCQQAKVGRFRLIKLVGPLDAHTLNRTDLTAARGRRR